MNAKDWRTVAGSVNAHSGKEGDAVKKNQPLFVIEAMKMESIVAAQKEGNSKVILKEGAVVEQDDWVLEIL